MLESAREAKSSMERKEELIINQLENDQIAFEDDYSDFDHESLPEHYWNMEYLEAKENYTGSLSAFGIPIISMILHPISHGKQ